MPFGHNCIIIDFNGKVGGRAARIKVKAVVFVGFIRVDKRVGVAQLRTGTVTVKRKDFREQGVRRRQFDILERAVCFQSAAEQHFLAQDQGKVGRIFTCFFAFSQQDDRKREPIDAIRLQTCKSVEGNELFVLLIAGQIIYPFIACLMILSVLVEIVELFRCNGEKGKGKA